MASTVESVQPSTSNFPTTITAEILVENLPSAQVVTTSTSMASTVSMSVSNSSLLAAISSPNANNNNNNDSSQSDSSSPSLSQIPAAPVDAPVPSTPEKQHNTGEPDAKRRKLDTPTKAKIVEKLEARLGGILCCAVCLDLPRTAMYQCPMGHLMCAACFTHLLADGRLRDQVATCPNCRVEISKQNASRNLAVEKAVSELPSQCQYCSNEYPSKSLEHHELNECDERPTDCKFARIGCQWKGPIHEATEHEKVCIHPRKSGGEVMSALEARDAKHAEEKKLFLSLVDLLSYEKIIFNDLQLKPYRTDEYVHKLYYETSKFSAFNHQWVVKATINNSQRDVHESSERSIAYQLILKSKTTCPLQIHYFVLKGPFSDMKVNTKIYKHDFTDSENESKNNVLPLPDTAECNRHLASKAINFRLIMFLASK